MRMQGMSQWILWEVSALFEAIGTIRDGIGTMAKPISLVDKPNAGKLTAKKGEIAFESVSFGYGKPVPAVGPLTLTIRAGEKSALSAAPEPANPRSSTCCCASMTPIAGASPLMGRRFPPSRRNPCAPGSAL